MDTAETRLERMLQQARARSARYYAANKSVCNARKRALRQRRRAERETSTAAAKHRQAITITEK